MVTPNPRHRGTLLATVETDRGVAQVWRHRPGLISSSGRGHFELDVAHMLIRVGDAEIRGGSVPLVHFMDWSEVTGYDSRGRRLCTDWAMKQGRPYPELHILTGHRLINMGVSAAGLALAVAGRTLQSYASREAFDQALAAQMRAF